MEAHKILIFKTNISTVSKYLVVKWMLDRHPDIKKWTVDLEDCDNVLRIVGRSNLNECALKLQVNSIGYNCEPLR